MPQQSQTSLDGGTGRTVCNLLLDYLKLEGVTHIFGIPGGGIMYLLEALRLRQREFTYVVARQETGAAYMADGLHRVTGGLGVVIVTTGPGATNAVTGVMNAQSDHSAILAITGEVAECYFGKGFLQQGVDGGLNVTAIYRNVTAYSATIASPDDFAILFPQALRTAMSIPFAAAHVSLPVDVSNLIPSIPVAVPRRPEAYRSVPRAGDPGRTKRALALLAAARRPAILIGNGCSFALRGERLARFAAVVTRFGFPVMTSPDGKAIFPESHPLSLRNYGLAGCLWPSCYLSGLQPRTGAASAPGYDSLMVLGSGLGGLATKNWDPLLMPAGPLIQVDADPMVIGRGFEIELGIVADLAEFIDDFCALSSGFEPNLDAVNERKAYVAWIKDAYTPWFDPDKRGSVASPILPQAAMRVINDCAPEGANIFVDCANCVGWVLNYLALDPPTRLHLSLDMGPMGFGVCSVIGGKIGAPGTACIAITGDGAFLMHGTEVSTAVQNRVGAIWVVLNDNDLAMVSQGNAHFFPEPAEPSWKDCYKLGNPDLVLFSRGLGAEACGVSSPAELREALGQAIARADRVCRPQVIVVGIDRNEVPPYYRAAPTAAS
jgi:acetolactate synthase I/II/III large subunit